MASSVARSSVARASVARASVASPAAEVGAGADSFLPAGMGGAVQYVVDSVAGVFEGDGDEEDAAAAEVPAISFPRDGHKRADSRVGATPPRRLQRADSSFDQLPDVLIESMLRQLPLPERLTTTLTVCKALRGFAKEPTLWQSMKLADGTTAKKNFNIYYEIDGEEVGSALRIDKYGGDEDVSWVLLEAVAGA